MSHSNWILATAVACACIACSQQSPTAAGGPADAGSAASPAAAGVPRPAATTPDLGIDTAYIDHGVKPGDDFFLYANGAWLKTAQIPPDRSSTGAFYDIFQKTEQHTADLIRNAGKQQPAAGSNARKIADYYAAYMDTAAIDRPASRRSSRSLTGSRRSSPASTWPACSAAACARTSIRSTTPTTTPRTCSGCS